MKDFVCLFKNKKICDDIPKVSYSEWENIRNFNNHNLKNGIAKINYMFTEGPLVKFLDDFTHYFIAIRYTLTCKKGSEESNSEHIMTFFQKDYSSQYDWMLAEDEVSIDIISQIKEVYNEVYNSPWLESLITNKEAELKVNDQEKRCSVKLYEPKNKDFVCLFKNKEICDDIPEIRYNEWHDVIRYFYENSTNTIDKEDDVFIKNGPLVKFLDNDGHSVISMRYILTCEKGFEKLNDEHLMTFFQYGYSSQDDWILINHDTSSEYYNIKDLKSQIKAVYNSPWLESLITNKEAELTVSDQEKRCSVKLYEPKNKDFVCLFKNKEICDGIPEIRYNEWQDIIRYFYYNSDKEDDIFIKNGPLVKFWDNYDRSAIAIKYTLTCPKIFEKLNGEHVMTFSQKYHNSQYQWMLVEYRGYSKNDNSRYINSEIKEVYNSPWLESLITTKKAGLTVSDHNKVTTCFVELYEKPLSAEHSSATSQPSEDL